MTVTQVGRCTLIGSVVAFVLCFLVVAGTETVALWSIIAVGIAWVICAVIAAAFAYEFITSGLDARRYRNEYRRHVAQRRYMGTR